MAEARREAEAMVQRAAKTAEATSADILAKARTDAEQITARARDEIAAEKDRALAEIRGEVADLALEAAGKLVGIRDERAHPAPPGGAVPGGEPQLTDGWTRHRRSPLRRGRLPGGPR